MITKDGEYFVLMSKDGKKRLFKSKSYQEVVNKEAQIEMYKEKARQKRNEKK